MKPQLREEIEQILTKLEINGWQLTKLVNKDAKPYIIKGRWGRQRVKDALDHIDSYEIDLVVHNDGDTSYVMFICDDEEVYELNYGLKLQRVLIS